MGKEKEVKPIIVSSTRMSSFLFEGIKIDLKPGKQVKDGNGRLAVLHSANVYELGLDDKKLDSKKRTQLVRFIDKMKTWTKVIVEG